MVSAKDGNINVLVSLVKLLKAKNTRNKKNHTETYLSVVATQARSLSYVCQATEIKIW